MRIRRSALIVPLSNDRFVAKAHLRGADTIILDLEDGVATNAKDAARRRLAEAVQSAGRGGAEIAVRVNGSSLGLLVRDLEAAVIAGVHGVSLAKVESAGHVRLVSRYMAELEAARGLPVGGITLTAAIETPQALRQVHEIAGADPRLSAIGLGSLDFAAACGFEPSFESLLAPKQTVLFAAKAAGIESGGYVGGIADYTDLDALRRLIRRSKAYGFHGGNAIHPDQVTVLNEEFGPSAADIAEARTLVAMAEREFAAGRGAFPHGGKMVDKPVIDAARAKVAIADAVDRLEARRARLLREAG